MVKKTKDEIDEAAKDGSETQAPPEGELKTTPEPEQEGDVVSLSSKEHQELVRQAKSAADLGRTLQTTLVANTTLQQSFDAQLKRYSNLETDFNTFRQRDRDGELEKFKDDKGVIDVIRLRHTAEDEREQVRRDRSDVDRDRAQHQTELDEAKKSKAETLAKELATDSGLAETLILQLGTDTAQDGRTTYNLDRMKQIAKSVPKGETPEEEEEGEEPQVRGQRSRAPGAGSRSATRGLSTMQDYDEAYNRGEINADAYAKARIRFGVAY